MIWETMQTPFAVVCTVFIVAVALYSITRMITKKEEQKRFIQRMWEVEDRERIERDKAIPYRTSNAEGEG